MPYRVFHDPEVHAREQRRIFQGPAWRTAQRRHREARSAVAIQAGLPRSAKLARKDGEGSARSLGVTVGGSFYSLGETPAPARSPVTSW